MYQYGREGLMRQTTFAFIGTMVNCRILPGESMAEVQKTLARVLANDKIKITPTHRRRSRARYSHPSRR